MTLQPVTGMLYPLLILEHLWQHVTMDFKLMPKDKAGYNNIFVVINHLSKQAVSTHCHKTITAKEIAWLYIVFIY